VAFVFAESRSPAPMLPLNLFRSRTFAGVNLLTLFLYAALSGVFFFLPLNLIQVQGYTPTAAGGALLPFILLVFVLSGWSGGLIKRYGARKPLIIGPLIASVGFGLYAVPGIGGSYWTTFFPGIIMFGLGMSFTVAPLTSTVMTSVSDHLSGTASGVNNALTRISNVFANAIFGALAVLLFAGALQDQLQSIPLDPNVKQSVVNEASNLGNATVPKGVDAKYVKAINAGYRESFIHAYSGIMKISAGLGFLGALMTVIFIRNRTLKKE